MKNLTLIILLFLSFTTINAQEVKKTRKERKAEKLEMLKVQTRTLVNEGTWVFDADRLITGNNETKTISGGYHITLKDGYINSYLPYVGETYTVDYGSIQSPMEFESMVNDYNLRAGKRGGYVINFSARRGQDKINFAFTIEANGSVDLKVNSSYRQTISYSGDIIPLEEKKK